MINWTNIATIAEKVATAIEEFAPVAGAAGPAGAAIGAALAQGAAFVKSALEAASEAGAVIGTQDLATIEAAAARIQAANALLADEIAKS